MTYREAVREPPCARRWRRDERVFLMGEDVGRYGGAFAVSHGLLEEFGPERVRDTPLSESAFVGAGIGAAMGGLRPIVEVMTINFSLLALDQIVNNAATLRYMSGGQFSVPLVVRMATGGGRQLAAQHSHSLEGWYAHVPGIKVLAPATVADARGMLLGRARASRTRSSSSSTRRSTRSRARSTRRPVPPTSAARRCAATGRDVTLVTYGGSLGKCLEAAERLARGRDRGRGHRPALAAAARHRTPCSPRSRRRTGSCRRRGLADAAASPREISAQIMERGFDLLDWPVQRVCSAEVPMPYAKHLEDAALPERRARSSRVVREMVV